MGVWCLFLEADQEKTPGTLRVRATRTKLTVGDA